MHELVTLNDILGYITLFHCCMYGESYESVFMFVSNFLARRMYHDEMFYLYHPRTHFIAGRMCHDEVFFFTIQGLIPHESVHWNV